MATATVTHSVNPELTSLPDLDIERDPGVEDAPEETAEAPRPGSRSLAALRISTGFVFLWAFLDKAFGFGYATPHDAAWVRGGSPTEGFLSHVAVGPLEGWFHDIAGAPWADWLFMMGLLGVGVAVIAGIGLRAAAVSGTAMMALMWMAEWPLAKTLSTGEPSMSTNPIVDYHVIYALALVVVALTAAGDRWGLGRMWARLPIVRRHPGVLR